jgi:hypothetical protein
VDTRQFLNRLQGELLTGRWDEWVTASLGIIGQNDRAVCQGIEKFVW